MCVFFFQNLGISRRPIYSRMTVLGTTKPGLTPRNLGNLLASLIAPAGILSSPSLTTMCGEQGSFMLSPTQPHDQDGNGHLHPHLRLWAHLPTGMFNTCMAAVHTEKYHS